MIHPFRHIGCQIEGVTYGPIAFDYVQLPATVLGLSAVPSVDVA
jgi:hypothetical protein